MFDTNVQLLREQVQNNEGLLFIIAAEAFFALMNASAKLLRTDVSVLEIVWIRMVVTFVGSVAYMYYAKIDNPVLGPAGCRVLLACRGLAGFFGIWGLYFSLQYLSLADAMALTFLTPLCATVLGALLLNEKFGTKEAVVAALCLVGAFLIARPPFLFGSTSDHTTSSGVELRGLEDMDVRQITSTERMIAVGGALLGVAGDAIEYTLIGIIGKRAHPLHNTTYLAMVCVIVTSISMIVMKTPIIIPTQWTFAGLLFLVGVFGMISQTLMTMGYQRGDVGRASMGVYTGMVFALIIGKVVFGSVPGALSIVGTILILGSAFYAAVTKEKDIKQVGAKVPGNVEDGDVGIRLLDIQERGDIE